MNFLQNCTRGGILLSVGVALATGGYAQVSTINSAVVNPRFYNDVPSATLTVVTNYPSLISFNEQNVSSASGFANRDVWHFSSDHGVTAYQFQSNDYFQVSMTLTLVGDPSTPRKEAGFVFNNPANDGGEFILDTDAHEVVAFGGFLPFYAFPRFFNSGDSVTLGITYFRDQNGKNAIIYSANGTNSPPLELSNTEQGVINNTTIGGYFQIQKDSTNPTNSGSATFQNISITRAPVTFTVNTVDNTDFSAGKTNLVAVLKSLVNGDTVNFNIPGTGVHTINTPADGYPLITANNITIDGYTQPGASPNTASIHAANNAQIMICLSSVNSNALSMYSAVTNAAGIDYPNLGFGDSEQAVLGFFRTTHAWVKGLAFLAAPATVTSQSPDPSQNACKTICFAPDAADVSSQACQDFHVSGCWFGIDPATRQIAYMPDGTTLATPTICIATYGTGTNGTPGVTNVGNITAYSSGTIGVAPGSTNSRAEFNVFLTGYGFDSQGGPFRISGNFWNVLPDGTTLADISALNTGSQQGDAYVEFGSGHDILIGTDGDGVNDADEGNIFGSYAGGGIGIYYYGSQTNTIIAGNSFGVDVSGKSFGVGQQTKIVHHFNNGAIVRFGSDFNGVSDDLEGNTVVDSMLFDLDTGSTTNTHWISARGNSFVNTTTPNGSTPPIGDGQSSINGLDIFTNFVDVSGPNGTLAIIPVIGGVTTTGFLVGTCGKPAGAPFTRLVVDLYEADTTSGAPPQGKKWLASFIDNSPEDLDTNVGSFKFALPAGLVSSGTKITMAVTYSGDPQPVLGLQRAGGQTTLDITGATGSTFRILQSPVVAGPYSSIAIVNGTSTTFTDTANSSFYKVTSGSASGQTSPFSALFTVP